MANILSLYDLDNDGNVQNNPDNDDNDQDNDDNDNNNDDDSKDNNDDDEAKDVEQQLKEFEAILPVAKMKFKLSALDHKVNKSIHDKLGGANYHHQLLQVQLVQGMHDIQPTSDMPMSNIVKISDELNNKTMVVSNLVELIHESTKDLDIIQNIVELAVSHCGAAESNWVKTDKIKYQSDQTKWAKILQRVKTLNEKTLNNVCIYYFTKFCNCYPCTHFK